MHVLALSLFRTLYSNYAVLTLLRRQVLIAISLLSEITNDF